MKKKRPDNYEAAYTELQDILQSVQNPETTLDDLQVHIQRADVLIRYCQEKLRSLEETVEGFLDEDTAS